MFFHKENLRFSTEKIKIFIIMKKIIKELPKLLPAGS